MQLQWRANRSSGAKARFFIDGLDGAAEAAPLQSGSAQQTSTADKNGERLEKD
jgi:hypothetical protein